MNAIRSHPRAKARQQAFTVKELLVILFMLALLGTAAIGSMSGARDRTIIAQCESNLRQFSLAFLIYGGENNDKMPSLTSGGFWAWDLPWAAGNSLNAYGAPWQVMYCPGTASRFSLTDDFALYTNYATGFFHVVDYALTLGGGTLNPTNVNSSIVPQSLAFGPAIMPPALPSRRVLLADATLNLQANGSGSWDSIPGGYSKAHTTSHMAGSVPAGGNVAFLDSHVEWRAFSQMVVRTTATGAPYFFW
jgi:prepilin-type processing-associated H-X9-DG protein